MDGVEPEERADAAAGTVAAVAAPASPAPAPAAAASPDAVPVGASRRGRRRLVFDLSALAVVFVLLFAALAATGAVLYQQLYSPEAFVKRYLSLLSEGRALDALAVPGVPVDAMQRTSSGLPDTASEALLRRDVLAPLHDVRTVSVEQRDGATAVEMSYTVGPYDGTSTFLVEQTGWVGFAPTWRFARSPLALIDLSVRGSMQFSVNGFEIDKRQISPDGADADPLAPVSLLVLSPGYYSVSVTTPVAESPGVAVVSDSPLARIPVQVQAQPTAEFARIVQEKVDAFLTSCATQQVLNPTGCPFGYYVQNRIASLPAWSITTQPTVTLVPDGAGWRIDPTEGVAHLDLDIRSIYDGSIRSVSEDVPFSIAGSVSIQPDGSAAIQVSPAG